MLQIVGIVGLIILFSIAIPTYDKWSYKALYKRQGKRDEKKKRRS